MAENDAITTSVTTCWLGGFDQIDGPSRAAWTLPYIVSVNDESPFGISVSYPNFFPGEKTTDGRLKWYGTAAHKDLIMSAEVCAISRVEIFLQANPLKLIREVPWPWTMTLFPSRKVFSWLHITPHILRKTDILFSVGLECRQILIRLIITTGVIEIGVFAVDDDVQTDDVNQFLRQGSGHILEYLNPKHAYPDWSPDLKGDHCCSSIITDSISCCLQELRDNHEAHLVGFSEEGLSATVLINAEDNFEGFMQTYLVRGMVRIS